MKIGDKYFCYKTLSIKESKNSNIKDLFIKGNFYKIDNLYEYQCYVNIEDKENPYKCFDFTLVKGGKYYFSDYFADIKKLRQEKLKKINEQQ